MPDTPLDLLLKEADEAYRPFPQFDEWQRIPVDSVLWSPYEARLDRLKEGPTDLYQKALQIVRRAAAVDTGAIEGLYDADWGFTLTLAAQAANIDHALRGKSRTVRELLEAQIVAYDHALDVATRKEPITEAWIRALHAQICRPQATYVALTEVGEQEQALPKGQYKTSPNHVRKPDGSFLSFAPVDQTPGEMHRLVQQLQTSQFRSAHVALRASYAHYCLVSTHPFTDGNGRVARALASVFTFEAHSIPLMILVDRRDEYVRALRAADRGEYAVFVDFILNRLIDAVVLAETSLRAAEGPPLDKSIASLRKLYVTTGGFRHDEVDRAGWELLEVFHTELLQKAQEVAIEGTLMLEVLKMSGDYEPEDKRYRRIPMADRIRLRVVTAPPAASSTDIVFGAEVPRDCGIGDELRVRRISGQVVVSGRLSDADPVSAILRMRTRIAVEGLLAAIIDEVLPGAARQVSRAYPQTSG